MTVRRGRSHGHPHLVLTLCLAATGCTTVGPDFVRPDAPVPETWLSADDVSVITERSEYEAWWQVFQDPALTRLVDQAYRQNLNLQIAGLRILEARAQLGIAVGLQYPQSQSFGGGYVRSKSSENQPPFSSLPPDVSNRIDTSTDFWNLSFDAAWEADIWGGFRRGIGAASANVRRLCSATMQPW